jgi:AraC family transcriptional regulator
MGTPISKAFSDSLSVALISALAGMDTDEYGRRSSQGGLAPWQVRRVTGFLLENLTEDLELRTQADLIGLSTSHFCRAFKVSTGMSPHQWLLKARVEKAKQHLLLSEIPIAEVALSVGFADQAHFTRTFSRLEGISPRAWQRSRYT